MARPKEFHQEQVLDKAMDLFWCQGYEATSIQDLVDHLGIKRQSLYDTFGDKYRLFLAALSRYKEMNLTQLVSLLEGPETGKAAIERVFQGVIENSVKQTPRCGCFMMNTIIEMAPHDNVIARITTAYMTRVESAFYHALLCAQRQGELSESAHIQTLARFLPSSLFGLRTVAKAGLSKAALQEIAEVALSTLS